MSVWDYIPLPPPFNAEESKRNKEKEANEYYPGMAKLQDYRMGGSYGPVKGEYRHYRFVTPRPSNKYYPVVMDAMKRRQEVIDSHDREEYIRGIRMRQALSDHRDIQPGREPQFQQMRGFYRTFNTKRRHNVKIMRWPAW